MNMKSTNTVVSCMTLKRSAFMLLCAAILGGCSTYPAWIPSSGPSKDQIEEVRNNPSEVKGIQIVDITDTLARKQMAARKTQSFSDVFSNDTGTDSSDYHISDGDVIEVLIWEAPPASLFGSGAVSPMGMSTSNMTRLPEQMVGRDGMINIPFARQIKVSGLTPSQVEEVIAGRLKNLANQPQVMVRVIQNNSSAVTVVGEVASSVRMPLTARGERLLDALATAGGVRQSINKMTVQITRGDKVASLPLDTVIQDPRQNIRLRSGDVVTSLFQAMSFTVLGAAGKNEEINFESKGISLAQAMARAGGLQDHRSDAQGVFIFRFEDPEVLDLKESPITTPEGKVPVVYRVNLKDPATFFVAQNFPIEDKDLMYVSNASTAELQKFLNIVMGSIVYPVLTIKTLTN